MCRRFQPTAALPRGNGGLRRRAFRCADLRFRGREIGKPGQNPGDEVRLIPPGYVKSFVKRQKNDAADAEAICEVSSGLRGNQTIRGIV